MSDVVVLVLGDRCFEVLRKDGHMVDYCDADGVVVRDDLANLQAAGYVAACRLAKSSRTTTPSATQ